MAHGIPSPLSGTEQVRIVQAVGAAEARTSAEIRVVVRQSPLVTHSLYSLLWAALASLVLPWGLLLAWPLEPFSLLAAQAGAFVILAALFLHPALAPRMVPRHALRTAAREAALEQFFAHGIPQTAGRTGILILAAAPERLVEVVADEGVHRLLGHEAWAAVCAAVSQRAGQGDLASGLVAGVDLAGELLGGPLPRQPGDVNELDDRVVIV